jgi:hypothetical protein
MVQQRQAVIDLVASHREQERTVGEVLESENSSMRSRSKIRSIAIGGSKGYCNSGESICRRR